MDKDQYHLIGVGIGPANLSLAALLQPCNDIKRIFLDRRNEFIWHPGLLFSNAELQVAYLKDLVSLVAPTSPYSFLEFLRENGRLYSFINANFPHVLRREFNEYYRWACGKLPDLEFGSEVTSIDVGRGGFEVATSLGVRHAEHLVIGTGLVPNIPAYAEPFLGDTLFHASEFLRRKVDAKGRRVAIIGGGQTGAEVFLNLMTSDATLPASISWISRRPNFLPLDDTPFINEQFTPGYSDYFFGLPQPVRESIIEAQKLTSDGISPSTLESIYRRLYELKFLARHECAWELRPGRSLERIARATAGFDLTMRDAATGQMQSLQADLVILCTGYTARLPKCLAPIRDRIALNSRGEYVVRPDYSIEWAGPSHHKIYVQNASRTQRGLADPNLSLLSWRSAKIVNSVARRTVYDVDNNQSILDWPQAHHAALAHETPAAAPRSFALMRDAEPAADAVRG
ncbi:lysine N(6)-hydroxylase/L-ornithine N(5)-oxygenase family protein [Trinickia fusca]|uniref:L-lysine 6-monooxygenase n=1 Tax=Trinickia fusca TaxID=2419777 RepID=A0A494X9Y8_9BURK|nr:SidA/IucD/PvdA family monooxygenase [Trinickia fusca]RKP45256.1 L-lysine 6-monooxygenase [Trinickia fusca]